LYKHPLSGSRDFKVKSGQGGKSLTYVTALQGCGFRVWVSKVVPRGIRSDQLLVNAQALNVGCALCFKGHKDDGR